MSNFYNFLKEEKEYGAIEQSLRKTGKTAVFGCIDGAKAHLIQSLCSDFDCKLIITADEIRAKQLVEEYKNFDEQTLYFPPKDFLFFSADIHGNLLARERILALSSLLENEHCTIVTTIDACLNPLLPPEQMKKSTCTLKVGDVLHLNQLSRKLILMGYERTSQVVAAGQFSIRGGIIDIFSLTEVNPVRIELWDDEIDSIRSFDCESQRSIDNEEEFTIHSATEVVLDDENTLFDGINKLEKECKEYEKSLQKQNKTEEAYRIKSTVSALIEELKEGLFASGIDSYIQYFCKNTVSILEYLSKNSCVILDEISRLKEKLHAVEVEFTESMKMRLEKGYILPRQMEILDTEKDFLYKVSKYHYLGLAMLEQKDSWIPLEGRFTLLSKSVSSYQEHVEELVTDLRDFCNRKYRVIMMTPSRTKGERLAKELFLNYQLPASFNIDSNVEVEPGKILIIVGNLSKGFEYANVRTIVMTEGDLFGRKKTRKRKKHTSEGAPIRKFTDVTIGDYVIHENHGLGIYKGVEQVDVQGMVKDYLKIEYGDGGNLYVPVTQLDLIQKYSKGEGTRAPKLNSLGSKEWSQTKKKVRNSVQNIAKELVELYAARQNKKGYQYSKDTIWQKEFEELFPYEETDDQLAAIEATKQDMESTKIMDRLVCGDVGFGKTEVAIRAAFKAVQDSKQVVYLVPTTILAQQHYNTFVQRMANYPVRIELLSRFRTPAQIKHTLSDLKKGLVDIVIGTHRVLSKDVVFKDLGLLIVDEEQRFGVTHKEKIKHLKENVDVLTLTATPIPRTLHMSMIGIRDMSVLEEAPLDRVPIQTYVMEYDTELIREAINRELARGGQVYYVSNRVKDIEEVTAQVQMMVPDATVAFAHGKMSERTLEKIMMSFINGEIDVLVSTTIIETGLDISNVNTIIIQDSDRFGLSQLYQLRGRVGRSTRTSYAFLTYTRGKLLKEVAEKRLSAIRQFTELGSGVKIAMQDLEIRGAGNILGAEQHGHMEAVGYDLYCKMLNQAVRSLKENKETVDFDTTIDMALDAYLPSSYIENESQKLDMYKKIASIENEKDYSDLQDELIDRYGELPLAAQYLLRVSLLKAQAHRCYVLDLVGKPRTITITMHENAPFNLDNLQAFLNLYRGRLRVIPGKNPKFIYEAAKSSFLVSEDLFTITKELLENIKKHLLFTEG